MYAPNICSRNGSIIASWQKKNLASVRIMEAATSTKTATKLARENSMGSDFV